MKTLLSLFDYTGNWAQPFLNSGWNVILCDIKHERNKNVDYVTTFGDISEFNTEFMYENIFQNFGTIDGILAAAPCTDFAVSGARHFKEKDEDGRTDKSVEIVYQTLRIIDLCMPDFWVIENPISRIHKLVPEIGEPVMYFNPCDFGEPYTKKTALYGKFNTNLKQNRVEPTEGSKMHKLYGGKSEKTKELRSVTPMGFARAFCEANKDWDSSHIGEQQKIF